MVGRFLAPWCSDGDYLKAVPHVICQGSAPSWTPLDTYYLSLVLT